MRRITRKVLSTAGILALILILFIIDTLITDSLVGYVTTIDEPTGLLARAELRVYQYKVGIFLAVKIAELQIALFVIFYPVAKSIWQPPSPIIRSVVAAQEQRPLDQ